MSDFAVEYGVLADYGTRMGTTTAEAAALLRQARVDSPASAMAGGLAATAAALLQLRLESASQRVGSHLAEHPRKLVESANAYREVETSSVGLVRETFGGQ